MASFTPFDHYSPHCCSKYTPNIPSLYVCPILSPVIPTNAFKCQLIDCLSVGSLMVFAFVPLRAFPLAITLMDGLCYYYFDGQTLGKLICGLKVVNVPNTDKPLRGKQIASLSGAFALHFSTILQTTSKQPLNTLIYPHIHQIFAPLFLIFKIKSNFHLTFLPNPPQSASASGLCFLTLTGCGECPTLKEGTDASTTLSLTPWLSILTLCKYRVYEDAFSCVQNPRSKI